MVNKVPKFIEKRVAERRRAAKSGTVSNRPKKFSAFDAARKQFEKKQEVLQEKEKERSEREALREEKQKERKKIGKLINKRNERGQPNMSAQLEILMKKYKN
jgi:hypothetical protein